MSVSDIATESIPGGVKPTISSAKVRPNGVPVIALSTGYVCSFDSALRSWTQLSGPWWTKGSECWEGRRGRIAASSDSKAIVRHIEGLVNDIVVERTVLRARAEAEGKTLSEDDSRMIIHLSDEENDPKGTDEDWVNALSLGHLESRLKAAVTLDSPEEYKQFLLIYAKRLASEAFRSKAEELIKELLGPVYYKPAGNEWKPTILGWNKRELCREVANIFGKLLVRLHFGN